MISSPLGPTGGPFVPHLLPSGGVPRVHGARSPVPSQLTHFATPRSVRRLGNVVAGAYPLLRPPDAWLPGLPGPLGPCYWLVAGGTPMGWRRGCLAAGLLLSTVCYYCRSGCSAMVVCAQRSQQVWGVGAGAGSCSSLPSRPSRCVLRAVNVQVSLPSACRYAIRCRLCVPRAQSGCPSGPTACPLGVGALVLQRRTRLPSLTGWVWRAHYTPFWCRAPVGAFQAVRAPPRFPPWSRRPSF